MASVTTPRLTLSLVDLPTYKAIFAGMHALSKHLNLSVPAEFSTFGIEPFHYTYNKLQENPADAP